VQFGLRSGNHTLDAHRPGAFPVALDFHVTRAQTVTLTLPPLRTIPLVQPVALPGPGATWQQISADPGGGWRLAARLPGAAPVQPGWGPTTADPTIPALLHLDRDGLTRLSVLETYPVADELVTNAGDRAWAAWEPSEQSGLPGSVGVLTIATATGDQTIPTSAAIRGLWWAPDGQTLLMARADEQGQELVLLDLHRNEPVVGSALITLPGTVQRVHWHPDGRAAVVISAADPVTPPRPLPTLPVTPTPDAIEPVATFPRRSAVLLRLTEAGVPTATRLRAPPDLVGGAVLLAWSETTAWWGADTGLGLGLDRIDLETGTIERIGSLPDTIVALTAMPDTTLRTIHVTPDGELHVQRWPEGDRLFTLPDIRLAPGGLRPGGLWHGAELLVAATPSELWLVQIDQEALN
jgi:hypothetical protein